MPSPQQRRTPNSVPRERGAAIARLLTQRRPREVLEALVLCTQPCRSAWLIEQTALDSVGVSDGLRGLHQLGLVERVAPGGVMPRWRATPAGRRALEQHPRQTPGE